jgi:SP family sugar:H+ symporter-like MFS transporter
MLGFFTPFITGAIDYRYGYVFAGCNLAAAITVFFFLVESSGRTLEEVDHMYLMHVPPIRSGKFVLGEDNAPVNLDNVYLGKGGRHILKRGEAEREGVVQDEGLLVGTSPAVAIPVNNSMA